MTCPKCGSDKARTEAPEGQRVQFHGPQGMMEMLACDCAYPTKGEAVVLPPVLLAWVSRRIEEEKRDLEWKLTPEYARWLLHRNVSPSR